MNFPPKNSKLGCQFKLTIGSMIGSEPSFSGKRRVKCLDSIFRDKLSQFFYIDIEDIISVLSFRSNLLKKVSSETKVPSKSIFQSFKLKLPLAEKEPL